MGWESEAQAALKEQKESLSARNALGMRIPKEVIQGEAAPEPRRRLGAFADIPNICALAREIKGNPLPCLEA